MWQTGVTVRPHGGTAHRRTDGLPVDHELWNHPTEATFANAVVAQFSELWLRYMISPHYFTGCFIHVESTECMNFMKFKLKLLNKFYMLILRLMMMLLRQRWTATYYTVLSMPFNYYGLFSPPADMMMYWILFLRGFSVSSSNDEEIKSTDFRRMVSWWQSFKGQLDTLPFRLGHFWILYWVLTIDCIWSLWFWL